MIMKNLYRNPTTILPTLCIVACGCRGGMFEAVYEEYVVVYTISFALRLLQPCYSLHTLPRHKERGRRGRAAELLAGDPLDHSTLRGCFYSVFPPFRFRNTIIAA